MTNAELAHRLLYFALLELRDHGRETGDKGVFRISDIYHNVPLALLQADSEEDYLRVIEDIRARAERHGCGDWLERRIGEITKASAGAT